MKRQTRRTCLKIGPFGSLGVMSSRFGAADTLKSVTEEEKMLKKLEIQRKKQLKKQRFALADENEEDTLTHGGKELDRVFVLCVSPSVTQAFKDLHGALDDDELGDIDPDLLMRTDLSKESDGNRDKPRTQREIMMEIIEKNKSYRDERRREAEAMTTQIEDVDAMMDDLQGLLHFRKACMHCISHHRTRKHLCRLPCNQRRTQVGLRAIPPIPRIRQAGIGDERGIEGQGDRPTEEPRGVWAFHPTMR